MKNSTVIDLKRSDSMSMDDRQIRIEKISVKNLYDYSCQIYNSIRKDDVIPISKYRALAHTKNPCADENDIGLLVAYRGNQCVGYIGIMPGLLRIGYRHQKIYWISTWYVPPKYRKNSIALSLLLKALSLNYDLIVSGMSEEAEKVYKGIRFLELGNLNYYVFRLDLINPLNLGLRLLQKIFRKFKIKLEINEEVINGATYLYAPIEKIIYGKILDSFKSSLNKISIKEVNKLDKNSKNEGGNGIFPEFCRDIQIINWMIHYKWAKELKKIEARDLNYYFAEIRKAFKYIALEIYSKDQKNYKGFIVFSVSENKLENVIKILDFHLFNSKDHQYIIPLAFKYASTFHANFIEIPEKLNVYLKTLPNMRFLIQKKKRSYLFYPKKKNSAIKKYSHDIILNYCDGDTAFS